MLSHVIAGLGSVGAAVAIVATAALADTDGAAPTANAVPVKIEHCTVGEQSGMENPKIGLRMSHISGVTIVYTNERQTAAAEIHFRIRYSGETYGVIDRGSITPGQKITREFTSLDGIFTSSSADCSVTAVTFTDGTHWNLPAPADAPSARP